MCIIWAEAVAPITRATMARARRRRWRVVLAGAGLAGELISVISFSLLDWVASSAVAAALLWRPAVWSNISLPPWVAGFSSAGKSVERESRTSPERPSQTLLLPNREWLGS